MSREPSPILKKLTGRKRSPALASRVDKRIKDSIIASSFIHNGNVYIAETTNGVQLIIPVITLLK